MKKKWTAYSVSIFALSKLFNKISLMTLLIAVTLYMISEVSAKEDVVPGVSAEEGVVPGVSADELVVPGVPADEGIVSGPSAEEMSNGKMAGIIRSANHSCAKVIALQSAGENSGKVKCNSGSFNVTRNANGQFSVYAFN